jgi:hypothetical protein
MATRTRSLGWLAVFATALTVTAASGCTSHDPKPNGGAACSVPTAPAGGVDGQADTAPGGGGLRVVEKGFNQVGDNGDKVSLGAVVENTSAQVAYRTQVTFGYTDAQHRSVATPNTRELRLEIPVILPGQRIPVGNSSYVIKEPNGVKTSTVAEMQVNLGAVHWVAKDATFEEISAKPKATTRNQTDPVAGEATYTMDSSYCRALSPRGVGMVFRNSTGAIIGGNLGLNQTAQKCAPGTSDEKTSISALPKEIDESKTEIYPYCDLAPAANPAMPDAPFNSF